MTDSVGPFDLRPDPMVGLDQRCPPPQSECLALPDGALPYRLYRMNALTGAVLAVENFSAFHDDEAIARALDAAGDQRIELWQERRKLAAISGRNGPIELTIAKPTAQPLGCCR